MILVVVMIIAKNINISILKTIELLDKSAFNKNNNSKSASSRNNGSKSAFSRNNSSKPTSEKNNNNNKVKFGGGDGKSIEYANKPEKSKAYFLGKKPWDIWYKTQNTGFLILFRPLRFRNPLTGCKK